jgi:hypothetical protein
MNRAINMRVPLKNGEFLGASAAIGFSRRLTFRLEYLANPACSYGPCWQLSLAHPWGTRGNHGFHRVSARSVWRVLQGQLHRMDMRIIAYGCITSEHVDAVIPTGTLLFIGALFWLDRSWDSFLSSVVMETTLRHNLCCWDQPPHPYIYMCVCVWGEVNLYLCSTN